MGRRGVIDPLTAAAAASAAFNAINRMVSAGKTIDETMSQLGKWYGAVSDFNEAKRVVENPPLFKRLVSKQSIEQEALSAFVASKKVAQQEYELQMLLRMHYGEAAYTELLRFRKEIRQQRKDQIYKQANRRRALVINVVYMALIMACLSGIYFLITAIRSATQ